MDIVEYKCPNCSADLKFVPSTQTLSCEYCGGSFTIEEVKSLFKKNEAALDSAAQETKRPGEGASNSGETAGTENETAAAEEAGSGEFSENTKLYHCASCGAEIMATDEQTALFCYYCHNPVILSGKMTGKYRPQKVIGFRIDRAEAEKKFKDWCFKPFVPKEFCTQKQLEKITGLYVPFWLADCTVDVDYSATGNKVRSWRSGNYDYVETKEYSLSRTGKIEAERIPADGSKRIDDELMESIEPFDYTDMNDFSMSYLSGFYAEKFDMGKEDMLPRIKERVESACRGIIANTVTGYSTVSTSKENYTFTKTDMNYVMLPVWFMSYKYQDKVYEFVLNGQTGKIAGTPPVNRGKLRLCAWGLAAAVTAVTYVLGGLILGGIF